MDIIKAVREFMIEDLSDEGFDENFGDDESLIDSFILDSLSILTLLSFIDEKFDIIPEYDEIDPEKFETVNKIGEYIRSKLET